MYDAITKTSDKIKQNALEGRRTLLLWFYAGHGVTIDGETYALLNSNRRPEYGWYGYYKSLDLTSLDGANTEGAYII